jgi:major membrane immunogen (membrane-anchored lipoprotein)
MILFVVGFGFAEGQAEGVRVAQSGSMDLEDGFYFAQQDSFSHGWKSVVTFEVNNGRIQNVEWDAANVKAGPGKDLLSQRGEYGMVANSGATVSWHEQANRMEQWLERTQNPRQLSVNSEGVTDAVSGVSITVSEFKELALQAAENGPVGRGQYEDGYYRAENPSFSHGWKDVAKLTVMGGRIVAAHWTALAEGGGEDKYTASENGNYGMVANSGATVHWYEQADKAAQLLLERQDPAAVPVNNDGTTDAVSGVSITVGGFFELAEKALDQGPEN